MRWNKIVFLLLIQIVVLTIACKKVSKTSWDTHNIIPLGRADMNIHDLVPDSLMKIDADKSVNLVYSHVISTLKVSDYLKLPDTTIIKTIALGHLDVNSGSISKKR